MFKRPFFWMPKHNDSMYAIRKKIEDEITNNSSHAIGETAMLTTINMPTSHYCK